MEHEDSKSSWFSLAPFLGDVPATAKNLDYPEVKNVPFHFHVSWLIKFGAWCGAFPARQSIRKSDIMARFLCIWLVYNLRKRCCCLGQRFRGINDLEFLSSTLSLSLVDYVCCIESIKLCVAIARPPAGSKDDPA